METREIQAAQGEPGASSVAHEMAPDEIPSPEKDREDEVEEAPLEASSGEAPEDPYASLTEAYCAATGRPVTPAGLRASHRRMHGFRERDAQDRGMTLHQFLATLPYRRGVSRLYDLPFPLRHEEALELLAET